MPLVKNRPVDSAPTRIRHRKSVEKLTAAQLRDLRRAIAAIASISDDRGYQYLASLHGGPPRAYCQHGQPEPSGVFRGASLFLPWHRAYLYHFELVLQDQVAEATLAWWDWTSPRSHADGIPAAYATETVRGAANPLFRQPIKPDRPAGGPPEMTWRTPDDPRLLPSASEVEEILGLGQFRDFTTPANGPSRSPSFRSSATTKEPHGSTTTCCASNASASSPTTKQHRLVTNAPPASGMTTGITAELRMALCRDDVSRERRTTDKARPVVSFSWCGRVRS